LPCPREPGRDAAPQEWIRLARGRKFKKNGNGNLATALAGNLAGEKKVKEITEKHADA